MPHGSSDCRALQSTNPALKVDVRVCDLADHESTERMVQSVLAEHGTLDVLINSAGRADFGLYERSSWETTENIIALNVRAVAYLTRRFLDPMVRAGRGAILNVNSGFGFHFLPGFAAYVGSKHFMTGFTEVLRSELSGTGVTISQLCPPAVNTEFINIALSTTGMDRPGWVILMSPESCVRWGLRGFESGRPLIVPGPLVRAALFVTRQLPRPLQRSVSNFAARWVRKTLGAGPG